MRLIKDQQNFGAALLFLVLGVIGIYLGLAYNFGTPAQMGPGFFPVLLSAGIALIGVMLGWRSLAIEGADIVRPRLRPLLCILAAILAFGVLIEPLGLLPTTIICSLVASLASPESRRVESIIIAVAMSIFVSVLFVYLLNQQMNIFWS